LVSFCAGGLGQERGVAGKTEVNDLSFLADGFAPIRGDQGQVILDPFDLPNDVVARTQTLEDAIQPRQPGRGGKTLFFIAGFSMERGCGPAPNLWHSHPGRTGVRVRNPF